MNISKIKDIFKKSYYSKWLLIGLVILGIVFRIHQYFLNHTLWLDEAFIAINIIRLNYLELFDKLKYYSQSAPAFFLIVVKFFTKIFGFSEFSFRFFPFITSVGTMIFAYFLGKLNHNKKTMPVFLLILAFSRFPIYYSGELKQYSSDLFFSVLILLSAFYANKLFYNYKSIIFLGIVSIFSIWFSHPAIIVIIGAMLAIFIDLIINRKKIKIKNLVVILITGFIVVLNFFINYFYFVRTTLLGIYYNNVASFFPPFPIKNIADLLWYPESLALVYNNPLGLAFHINNIYHLPYFILILQFVILTSAIIFGTISICKEKKWFKLSILLLIPLILFGLSILKKYPVFERLILFIIPCFYLIISEGIINIHDFFRKKIKFIGKFIGIIILLFFIIYPLIFEIYNIIKPELRRETKPAIEYYINNKQPNDKIYIYPSPSEDPVYIYYTQYYFKKFENQIYIDKKFEENKTEYLDELKSKMGKGRVWIVFPFNLKPEREILDYISNFGIQKYYFSSTSATYLFEIY